MLFWGGASGMLTLLDHSIFLNNILNASLLKYAHISSSDFRRSRVTLQTCVTLVWVAHCPAGDSGGGGNTVG